MLCPMARMRTVEHNICMYDGPHTDRQTTVERKLYVCLTATCVPSDFIHLYLTDIAWLLDIMNFK
jgi:hypothetical protein